MFEALIRIGSEQANDQADEHLTPREVIKLMVDVLLVPETELNFRDNVVKIYEANTSTFIQNNAQIAI